MTTPLTLEEFNTDFNVRIVDYQALENDVIKVTFEVRCNQNNRVGVFIANVDTTELAEEFDTQDVVTAAWDEVKTSANEWGVVNLPKVQFTTYTVDSVPVNSSITLQDFNTNFVVRIQRFELYPITSSNTWCIGFHVYNVNKASQNMYVDGTVPVADYCNNVLCDSVADAVWETVSDRVVTWASTQLARATVIDTQFTPVSV
jgi:hypothetical protein